MQEIIGIWEAHGQLLKTLLIKYALRTVKIGNSRVVQWFRISLAMQGTDQGTKIPLATAQLNLWVVTTESGHCDKNRVCHH